MDELQDWVRRIPTYEARKAAARASTAAWRCSSCGFERPWPDLPTRGRPCRQWTWYSGRGPADGRYHWNGSRCDGYMISLDERRSIEAAYRLGGKDAQELMYDTLIETLTPRRNIFGSYIPDADLRLLVTD